jgi:hypothetical protein
MAKVTVLVVHDEIGRIVSIARPAKGIKAIVGSEQGNLVFETEVDEETIVDLAAGGHRVDVAQQSLIRTGSTGTG